MKFILKNLALFLLVISFLFISVPEIKIMMAPIGIPLFVFFISVCLFTFKTPETIISGWIIVSPFTGYGFDLYGLTISLSDVFCLILILKIVFKVIKIDFNFFFLRRGIVLLILSFLFIIYLSIILSPLNKTLVENYSIIKITFNIIFIAFSLSIPKHFFYLESILKSFVLMGLFAVLLWFYEIYIFRSQLDSMFRTPSINSLVLFYAIGILSHSFLRFKNNLKPLWFLVIMLVILSSIATTRSGLIYSFICVILNIIILKKMNLFPKSLVFIFSGILMVAFYIITYKVLTFVNLDRATSTLERQDVLLYYFTVFKEYYFIGIGFGNWFSSISLVPNGSLLATTYSDTFGETSLNPHNTFVRIAVDTGVVGLFVFVKLLIYLFKNMKLFFKKIMIVQFYVPIFFSVLIVSFFISDIIETSFFWSFFLLGVGKYSYDV